MPSPDRGSPFCERLVVFTPQFCFAKLPPEVVEVAKFNRIALDERERLHNLYKGMSKSQLKVMSLFARHERGGRTKRYYNLIEALLDAGCEVHYLAVQPLELEAHPNLRPHIFSLPTKTRKGKIFWFWFGLLAPIHLLWITITQQFSVIAVFGTYFSLLSRIASFLTRTPVVVFMDSVPWRVENIVSRSMFRRRVSFFLNYLGLSGAKKIIAVTTAMEEELTRKIPSIKSKIVVLPNNVNYPASVRLEGGARPNEDDWHQWLESFSERKQTVLTRYNLPEKGILLTTSGELTKRKNIEYLVRSLGVSGNNKLSLIVCGDGPEKSRLLSVVVGYGLLNQVFLPGWLKDPMALISGSDVFVMTSRHEGMSQAMLEALGAGVAVIAVDTPEMRELLKYDELLFSPNDVEGLARKIDSLANKKGELERLRMLSHERGKHYTFSWERNVSSIIDEACRMS